MESAHGSTEVSLKLIEDEGGDKYFPVRCEVFTLELPTEYAIGPLHIVINQFSNRNLLIITEIGKPGTVYHVRRDKPNNCRTGSGARSDDVYTLDLVIGAESEELIVTARLLAEVLSIVKPMVLTLGFKDNKKLTLDAIRHIVDFIREKTK